MKRRGYTVRLSPARARAILNPRKQAQITAGPLVLIGVSGGVAEEFAGGSICEIRDQDNGESEFTDAECAAAEARTNVALAAPDLLAALEDAALTLNDAAKLLDTDDDENTAAEECRKSRDAARAAIAKAKGVRS